MLKEASLQKPKSKPPLPSPLENTESAAYETLDTTNPLDYTYPRPSPTDNSTSDQNSYSYASIPQDEGASPMQGGAQYHAQGPAVGQKKRAKLVTPPPIPSRDGNLYNVLGEDESAQYEDPTLPKFRVCISYISFTHLKLSVALRRPDYYEG